MFTLIKKWFLSCSATFILMPSCLFMFAERGYAGPNPDAVEISDFEPRVSEPSIIHTSLFGSINQENLPRIGERLSDFNKYLWVSGGTGASATLRYVFNGQVRPTAWMLAGPSSDSSTYYFPCRVGGGIYVIGWHKPGQLSCANPGLTVSAGQSRNTTPSVQRLTPTSIFVASNFDIPLTTQSPTLSNLFFPYCSVAAEKRGWWIRWGDFDNPCDEALEQCSKTGPLDRCEVLGIGNWLARDRSLLVAVECANDRSYKAMGSGLRVALRLISDLAQQAKSDSSTACVLNVYQPNDVIVSPATKQTTLIQTQDLGDSLSVDVLAGTVIIRSAQKTKGMILVAGERYKYPQDDIQNIDVFEVAQSPNLRRFLDVENWPQENESEIEDYISSLGKKGKIFFPKRGTSSEPNSNDGRDFPVRPFIDFFINIIRNRGRETPDPDIGTSFPAQGEGTTIP